MLDDMRIELLRSGGFAGAATRRQISVDTSTLPAAEAEQLEALARSLDAPAPAPASASSASSASSAPRYPDQFHYRLTIDDAGTVRTLTFSDATLRDHAAALVTTLLARTP